MHKICFTLSLFNASTCLEHHVLIVRRSKLYYTASGIITPIGGSAITISIEIFFYYKVSYYLIYAHAYICPNKTNLHPRPNKNQTITKKPALVEKKVTYKSQTQPRVYITYWACNSTVLNLSFFLTIDKFRIECLLDRASL